MSHKNLVPQTRPCATVKLVSPIEDVILVANLGLCYAGDLESRSRDLWAGRRCCRTAVCGRLAAAIVLCDRELFGGQDQALENLIERGEGRCGPHVYMDEILLGLGKVLIQCHS